MGGTHDGDDSDGDGDVDEDVISELREDIKSDFNQFPGAEWNRDLKTGVMKGSHDAVMTSKETANSDLGSSSSKNCITDGTILTTDPSPVPIINVEYKNEMNCGGGDPEAQNLM